MDPPDTMLLIPEQGLLNVVVIRTSCGTCLRGRYCGTGGLVSIKPLSVRGIQNSWWTAYTKQLVLLRQIQSKRILLPLGMYRGWTLKGLVSEWVEGGSLHAFLQETQCYPDLPLAIRLRILLDVAEGVAQLHALSIPHQGLRPTNVLLDCRYRAKVCDWGLWGRQSAHLSAGTMPCLRDLAYLAPEVLQGGPPTMEADLYSLGVLLLETMTGRLSCEDIGSPQTLLSQQWVRTPPALSYPLKQLLMRLCSSDPQKRPSAPDCVLELRRALATFDLDAADRDAIQLKDHKERALMGCKDQQTLEVKLEINNLQQGGYKDTKGTHNKTVPLNITQNTPSPQSAGQSRTIRHSTSQPTLGGATWAECATSARLRSHSEPVLQRQLMPSTFLPGIQQAASQCQQPVSYQAMDLYSYAQILREHRETIIRGMTEGRLNNLLDVLLAHQALSREEYELITAALTLAGRTRSLLDTCQCLGERVAALVASTLGFVSVTGVRSPTRLSH